MNPLAIIAWATSPAGRAAGVGLIVVAALGYGYMKGKEAGASDGLRARIEQLEADLAIAKSAEQHAERQSIAAADREATLKGRLDAYETDAASAKPDACRLSDGDAQRLRSLTR